LLRDVLEEYRKRIRGESGHIDEYRGHILDRIHQNTLKKLSWTYRERIRGVSGRIKTYQSCQDTPICQLEYWVRIARESHPHPYQIHIRYEIRCCFAESVQYS
jgi:hypothetical protein